MSRLFVTGLAGYLGRAVAHAARAAGWEVAGSIHERPADRDAEAYRLDVRDSAAVLDAVKTARSDAVIHTAYRRNGDEAGAVNADGAGNVAQAAHDVGARLVHVSSDVIFRGNPGRPLREDDPPDPLTDYGVTKASAEATVAELDPAAVLVRTSLIYGGDGSSDHERMAIDAAGGLIDATFFTDEYRCPVLASELASALVELAGRPDVNGPLHVAGADSLNRLEFARLVASHAGRDPNRLRGGEGPADRPKDLTLDCSRARELLSTAPRGARAVLGG
ncbi:MAG TPA: sugar nucleotide-binding protein [Solirubrobacteraceae bacterium]|nr:sugar nucleotide-binding protein [Solirubrobacteraceae bacterium]